MEASSSLPPPASGRPLIEKHQDRVRDGACYDAFWANRTVTAHDLLEVDRWPTYRDRALELGFRSVIGVPLNAHGETIGVLDVYRGWPGPWSREHVQASEVLTAMGAGYILHANRCRRRTSSPYSSRRPSTHVQSVAADVVERRTRPER